MGFFSAATETLQPTCWTELPSSVTLAVVLQFCSGSFSTDKYIVLHRHVIKRWHNVVARQRRASCLTSCPRLTSQRGHCSSLLPAQQFPGAPQPLSLQSEAAADLGLEPHVCFTSRMWVVLGCPFIQLASAVCGSAARPAAAVMAPAPAPASLAATAAPSSRHIPHGQLWHPPAWAESPSAFGSWYWVWPAFH